MNDQNGNPLSTGDMQWLRWHENSEQLLNTALPDNPSTPDEIRILRFHPAHV